MRSYIFTERERKTIFQYLYTPTETKNKDINTLKSRIKHFDLLPKDIELYIRLREAMKMDKHKFSFTR